MQINAVEKVFEKYFMLFFIKKLIVDKNKKITDNIQENKKDGRK